MMRRFRYLKINEQNKSKQELVTTITEQVLRIWERARVHTADKKNCYARVISVIGDWGKKSHIPAKRLNTDSAWGIPSCQVYGQVSVYAQVIYVERGDLKNCHPRYTRWHPENGRLHRLLPWTLLPESRSCNRNASPRRESLAWHVPMWGRLTFTSVG